MAEIKKLKFSAEEFLGKDIASLSDTPTDDGISAKELKARFDQVPKMMVALDRINGLIDALTSTKREESGAKNIGAVTASGQPTDVQTNLSAIWEAMSNSGYGDMLKARYDKDNDGVVDAAENAKTLRGKTEEELCVKKAAEADNAKEAQMAADAHALGGAEAAQYAKKEAPVFYGGARADYFLSDVYNFSNGMTLSNLNGEMVVQGGTNAAHMRSDRGVIVENKTGNAYTPITVSACRVQELQSKDGGECCVTFLADGNALVLQGGTQNSLQLRGPNVRCMNNTGNAWVDIYAKNFVNQSTRDSKKDIQEIKDEEARKLLLVPVKSFVYKDDEQEREQLGVIAEEIQELGIHNVLAKDEEGTLFGVDYSKFTPAIIRLCQLQQQQIEALNKTVQIQSEELAAIQRRMMADEQ